MYASAAAPTPFEAGDLLIRPARFSDIDAIVALHREAFADTFSAAFGRDDERGARALAASWRRQGASALRGMLVAEYADTVIGTISLRTRDALTESASVAESAFFEVLGVWGAIRSLFALSLLDHQIGYGEGFIADVAVAAAYRRRGVARALLQRAEQDARLRALEYLGLYVRETNHGARALYQQLGFQPVRARHSLLGKMLFGLSGWIYMRKDLNRSPAEH